MKVTLICVNVEKRLRRDGKGKPGDFLYRGQFEAAPLDVAPENKEAWPSTPQLSLDIPSTTTAFETGKLYSLELKPIK
jgi:hypothetical protein